MLELRIQQTTFFVASVVKPFKKNSAMIMRSINVCRLFFF
jgi:hypothetical protein